ncbi:unnamed protein product, partial [Medioppia subpectinata]
MPIGMFCWMTVQAIKMKSPEKILGQLGWFFGTVFLTYGSIWFIFYPTIYFLIIRKNCFKMNFNIIPAQIIAFGSSSSALTLPVTMKCMEEKNHLSQTVSQFVLPLAMTMHMPGAATYYPMVSLFVAQMHGMTITFQMTISLVCGGPEIVSAARSQIGVPYSWGGGSWKGKSYGIGKGAHTIGFDCSGLAQYAVYKGTGKIIQRVADAQYADGKCSKVAYS